STTPLYHVVSRNPTIQERSEGRRQTVTEQREVASPAAGTRRSRYNRWSRPVSRVATIPVQPSIPLVIPVVNIEPGDRFGSCAFKALQIRPQVAVRRAKYPVILEAPVDCVV